MSTSLSQLAAAVVRTVQAREEAERMEACSPCGPAAQALGLALVAEADAKRAHAAARKVSLAERSHS